MEILVSIINFCKEHMVEIWTVIASLITIASVIVKLTPTQKDDNVLAKIIAVLSKVALNKNLPPVVK